MSRLSASVNLLILYRKEPHEREEVASTHAALRDLLKASYFLHPSNVTQIPPTEEWLLHLQVASGTLAVFFCPVCYVLGSNTVEKQQGNPGCYPWLGV